MSSCLKLVKVLIPLYKEIPSVHEIISLQRCFDILSNYEIAIFTFYELDLSFYSRYCFSSVHYFDKTYFESIQGYNSLLLSYKFYSEFLDYEFILIYQLDSYVFHDSLKSWCQKNFDYIGAPWIKKNYNLSFRDFLINSIWWLKRFLKELDFPLISSGKIGNGGFSLRKVSKFIFVLDNIGYQVISKYISNSKDIRYNEDVFWSLELDKYNNLKLSKPSYDEALSFAIDGNPHTLISNFSIMPFGCHGWSKPNQLIFWKKFIDVN